MTGDDLRPLLQLVDDNDDEPDERFVERLWGDIRETATVGRDSEPDEPVEVITLRPRLDEATPRTTQRLGRRIAAAAAVLAVGVSVALFTTRGDDETPVASEQVVEQACGAFADTDPQALADIRLELATGDPQLAIEQLDEVITALADLLNHLERSLEFDDERLRPIRLILGALRQAAVEATTDLDRAGNSIGDAEIARNEVIDSRLQACLSPIDRGD